MGLDETAAVGEEANDGPSDRGEPAAEVEGYALVSVAEAIDDGLAAKHGVVDTGAVRVDRWLWAARLFKTRSQAAKACAAGHVKMDGDSVKAAKTVRVGDVVTVQTARRRVLQVVRLSERRGPAAVARALFHDYSPPLPPREEVSFGRRERGAGRPEKRDRRLLNRLRGR